MLTVTENYCKQWALHTTKVSWAERAPSNDLLICCPSACQSPSLMRSPPEPSQRYSPRMSSWTRLVHWVYSRCTVG